MSRAYLTCDRRTNGVPFDQWLAFCAEHSIIHSPLTGDGNVYRTGQVVITYETHMLDFWGVQGISGSSEAAQLALRAWCKWGGKISADSEVRRSVISKPSRTICVEPRLDDFHACLSDDRRIWGCGSTMSAAIGDLVRTHSVTLGLKIDNQAAEEDTPRATAPCIESDGSLAGNNAPRADPCTICLELEGNTFRAYIHDNREAWGWGFSAGGAIGDLVRGHAGALGLQFDLQIDLQKDASCETLSRTICLERGYDAFHAHIRGNRRAWGCGSSVSVAIGNLVWEHAATLGLQIASAPSVTTPAGAA